MAEAQLEGGTDRGPGHHVDSVSFARIWTSVGYILRQGLARTTIDTLYGAIQKLTNDPTVHKPDGRN